MCWYPNGNVFDIAGYPVLFGGSGVIGLDASVTGSNSPTLNLGVEELESVELRSEVQVLSQ